MKYTLFLTRRCNLACHYCYVGKVADRMSPDTRALGMVERIVVAAHGHGRKVSVCGKLAGNPHSAQILVGLGVDALSVAAVRFARVKFSLRDVTINDCRA